MGIYKRKKRMILIFFLFLVEILVTFFFVCRERVFFLLFLAAIVFYFFFSWPKACFSLIYIPTSVIKMDFLHHGDICISRGGKIEWKMVMKDGNFLEKGKNCWRDSACFVFCNKGFNLAKIMILKSHNFTLTFLLWNT